MLVNLMDLINFSDDERLSQKYVKYYLNFKVSKQYRHEEIITIKKMVELLELDYEYLGGFTYSFILPHLNKELDLIKVTKNSVINIELKSAKVSDGRILKQLNQNKYYLHLIHKPLYQYTYVMSENTFYKIDNDSLVKAKPEEVRKLLLNHKKAIPIDLGDIFKPENIFASPFYMTSRFIQNDYLLTDSEQLVERQIIKFLENDEDVIVEGPTGSGKTMVLYDVARKLEKGIIISPYQIESFKKLNEAFPSFKTISIEEFRNFDDIKYCFIDEVSKIEVKKINDIILEGKRKNIRIVLFLDLKENDEIMSSLLGITNNILRLTSPIRTSREALDFIDSLFYHKKFFNNPKYKVIYSSECYLASKINDYVKKGYTYISYEDNEKISDYSYKLYTKRAYPYEFQKIVMCIDDKFYLDEKKHLKSIQNDDGIYYTRLLYQGLTRAREEIVVIITNNKILAELIDIL